MFYNKTGVKGVHLELTTKCNANCPMCGRNSLGRVRPELKLTELTLSDCKKIFPLDFLRQLKNISLCGVYGDPILTKDLFLIIKYFLSVNPKIKIDLYTNGSIHPIEWWKKLAQIMGDGKVIFAIDGLSDTHQINRRGTDFNVILRNAQAFIEAGGKAQWDYIVFKHNEHQVAEARRLSKKLGFKYFQIKRTSRFYKLLYERDPALRDTGELFGKQPVYDQGRQCGYIELPQKSYYRNNSLATIKALIKKYGSMINYFDRVKIDCQAKKTKGIFVSATGHIFPCCWVYQQANYGNLYHATDQLELNESKILDAAGGLNSISAKTKSIATIIKGNFFQSIERGWRIKGLANGRPKVCARHCGCQLDMHQKQHQK